MPILYGPAKVFDMVLKELNHARVPSRTGKQKTNDNEVVTFHPAFTAVLAERAAA